MQERIRCARTAITPKLLENIKQLFNYRIRKYRDINGGHFEHPSVKKGNIFVFTKKYTIDTINSFFL